MFRIDIEDMHIRDERVLEWFKKNHQHNPVQLPAEKLAETFKCHPNTARAILGRLVSSQHIEIIDRPYRGGFIYKVSCGETRTCA